MPLGYEAHARAPPAGAEQRAQTGGLFKRPLTADQRAQVRGHLDALLSRADKGAPRPPAAPRSRGLSARERSAVALEGRLNEAIRVAAWGRWAAFRAARQARRYASPPPLPSPGRRARPPAAAAGGGLQRERSVSPPRRRRASQRRAHHAGSPPRPNSPAAQRSEARRNASPHRVRLCAGDTPPRGVRSPTPGPQLLGGGAFASYADLSGSQRHIIRCHITADLIARLIRRQYPVLNGTPRDVEQVEALTLKCFGPGERLARLEGLGGLRRLRRLVACGHSFTKIEGLAPLSATLTYLDLSSNRIARLEGVAQLEQLEYLDLSCNDLEHLPEHALPKSLRTLLLARNTLCSLDDLHSLRPLLHLQELDCTENPFCAHPHYRSVAVYAALSVVSLDGLRVSTEEREGAIYLWDRKSLKPLQAELQSKDAEVRELRAALENALREREQQKGQVDVLNGLLANYREDCEEVRAEKATYEAALKERERALTATQVEAMQHKSDLEFLRLEMHARMSPTEARDITARTTGTLAGPATPPQESSLRPQQRASDPDCAVSPESSIPDDDGYEAAPRRGSRAGEGDPHNHREEPRTGGAATAALPPPAARGDGGPRRTGAAGRSVGGSTRGSVAGDRITDRGSRRRGHSDPLPPEGLQAEVSQLAAFAADLAERLSPRTPPRSVSPSSASDDSGSARGTARRLQLGACSPQRLQVHAAQREVRAAELELEARRLRAEAARAAEAGSAGEMPRRRGSARPAAASSAGGGGSRRRAAAHARRPDRYDLSSDGLGHAARPPHRERWGNEEGTPPSTCPQHEPPRRWDDGDVRQRYAQPRPHHHSDPGPAAPQDRAWAEGPSAAPAQGVRSRLAAAAAPPAAPAAAQAAAGAGRDDTAQEQEIASLRAALEDTRRAKEREAEIAALRAALAEARREPPPAAASAAPAAPDPPGAPGVAGPPAPARPFRESFAPEGTAHSYPAPAVPAPVSPPPTQRSPGPVVRTRCAAVPTYSVRGRTPSGTAAALQGRPRASTTPQPGRQPLRTAPRGSPPRAAPGSPPLPSPPGRLVGSVRTPSASPSPQRQCGGMTPTTAPPDSPGKARRQFHRCLRKALHCAAIAGEYDRKARREDEKCSVEAAMAQLEAEVPHFEDALERIPAAQDAFVELARSRMSFHRERARWCARKGAHCQQCADKYIYRARALLPMVGDLDQESLRSLECLSALRGVEGGGD